MADLKASGGNAPAGDEKDVPLMSTASKGSTKTPASGSARGSLSGTKSTLDTDKVLVPGGSSARGSIAAPDRASRRKSFGVAYAGGEAPGFLVGDAKGDRRLSDRRKSRLSKPDEDVETDEDAESDKVTQGVGACVFTLSNTLLGLGLLKMPIVCAVYGIIPFLCATLVMGCISCCAGYLLTLGAGACTERAFVALGADAFGPIGGKLAAGLLMVQTFFIMVGYLSVAMSLLCLSKLGLILVVVFGMLPLCMLKDLSALKLTSYFACAIYFSVLPTVIYYNYAGSASDSSGSWAWFRSPSWAHLQELPSIIFGFTCQHSLLPLYDSLEQPTEERFMKVLKLGFASSWLLYATVGVLGYVAWGQTLIDNKPSLLMDMLDKDHWWTTTLLSCFVLAMLLGFPCIHFASRKAWMYMLLGPDAGFTWPKHAGVTVMNITLVTVGCLVLGGKIDFTLAWAGGLTLPTVMLFFPAVIFSKFGERLPLRSRAARNFMLAKIIIVAYALTVISCMYNNIRNHERLTEAKDPCTPLLSFLAFMCQSPPPVT